MPDLFIRTIIQKFDAHLRHIIKDEGKNKFVIYTNGMGGKLAREYLKTEFGIIPEYTIDNKRYNGSDILNIEQAQKRNNKSVYFLVCSWHPDYYDEIRRVIYEAFPNEQIIDIFPRAALPGKKEICAVLHHIDSYIRDLEDKSCG